MLLHNGLFFVLSIPYNPAPQWDAGVVGRQAGAQIKEICSMHRTQKGFTLIEILVVVTIIGVLAGLVVVLIPKGQEKANVAQCTNNVRNLTGLLIGTKGPKFPAYGGVNLLLYLVHSGEIVDEKKGKLFFCPGDQFDSWEDSGGMKAYKDSNLDQDGEYGHLSSYAGRDQKNKKCKASKSSPKSQALLADDSEDHHNNKGFVIGYNDSSVKYKLKFDDWKISIDTEIRVGEGSEVEDLKCLRTDDN